MSVAPPRVQCLEQAREAVLGRADDYGRPEDLFSAIAARWSLTLGISITARLVALCMIDMKTARLCAGIKSDSWVDIAGYAACGFEVDCRREPEAGATTP